MLEIRTKFGSSRHLATSSRPYSAPKLAGHVYAVVKRGTEYEVRCWTFKRGDLIDDALVNTFRFESVADEIARALAEGAEL